jgi:hypothetical protein
MSLWPPYREDQAKLDRSLAGAIPKGRSGRQTNRGASWSELLVARKHVPDRVGQATGDVDLGDLGPALLSEPLLVSLVAISVVVQTGETSLIRSALQSDRIDGDVLDVEQCNRVVVVAAQILAERKIGRPLSEGLHEYVAWD